MQPDFKHIIQLFDKINSTTAAMPQRVAVLAVNFSKERFIKKNWINESPEPWKKSRKKTGSTLVASGRLKRSIRKIRVGTDFVIIGTDVPYAKIHNEGGEISGTEKVRAHTRKTHTRKCKGKSQVVKQHTVKPFSRKYRRKFEARQFIGKSAELERQIGKFINDEFAKVVNGF